MRGRFTRLPYRSGAVIWTEICFRVVSISRQRSIFWKTVLLEAALLAAVFMFRLWFGFNANLSQDDERQSYLIGLKYFCTGMWPYFGPDVIDESRPDFPHIQIPGALEGVLIGIALRLW